MKQIRFWPDYALLTNLCAKDLLHEKCR